MYTAGVYLSFCLAIICYSVCVCVKMNQSKGDDEQFL